MQPWRTLRARAEIPSTAIAQTTDGGAARGTEGAMGEADPQESCGFSAARGGLRPRGRDVERTVNGVAW